MKALFTPSILKQFRSYKRLSTLLAAFVVIGVLTATFMIVSGRAAGLRLFSPTRTAAEVSGVPSFSSVMPGAPLALTTVYVDDSWVGTSPGADPDLGAGPAANFGTDSFATIQEGINAVDSAGTVVVYAGTYTENLTINKIVTLNGAQVGVNPNDGSWNDTRTNAANESIIHGAVNLSLRNNIVMDGFTVERTDLNEGHILIGSGNPTGVGASSSFNIQNNRFIGTRNTASPGSPWAGIHTNFLNDPLSPGAQFISHRNRITIAGAASGSGILVNANVPGTDGLGATTITETYVANSPGNGFNVNRPGASALISGNRAVNDDIFTFRANNTVITGNTISDAPQAAISNTGGSTTWTASNNTIISPRAQAFLVGSTFTVDPVSGMTISGNIVTVDPSLVGIGITTVFSPLQFAFIDIRGNLTGTNLANNNSISFNSNPRNPAVVGVYGLRVRGNVANLSVTNNTFDGNGVGGAGDATVSASSGVFVDTDAVTPSLDVDVQNNLINGWVNGVSFFDTIPGAPVAGVPPVQIISNTIRTNATGVRVEGQGPANLNFNRIVGNTAGLNNVDGTVTAENNWWGCNAGPGNAGCDTVTGVADTDPWIVLLGSATPSSIGPGGTSTVAADMTHNSAGGVPVGTLPNISDSFSATNGTMNPTSDTIVAGVDDSLFTSSNLSNAVATITVDNQPVDVAITVTLPSFAIDDVTQSEGSGGPGTTNYTFTITRTGATAFNTSVDYATVNGSATAPSDFTAITTTNLVFLPADSSKQVTVLVNGDTSVEPDEAFTVHLSNPSGATISDADGTGAITNDDACAAFATVYVDDSWAGTTVGTDPDSGGPATSFGCDSFATIQQGVNGVATGGTVNVLAGTYVEDVTISNAGLSLLGFGAGTKTISGVIGGNGTTVQIGASNVTVAGFTISREGNNTTDWNNAGLNSAGIAIQGLAITNTLIRDNVLTGNRTGIDINNSNGNTVRNNVIDFNRTGLIFRNQTDQMTVVENFITNNWTVGFVFLDASGGSNSPQQTALNSHFNNNNLSGNWYGQIVDRQSGGLLPAPGTTNLKNFRGNWFGTTTPVVTTDPSAEPGYAAQIPVAYGGSAAPPGGQPDIAGPASANIKYTPFLLSGTDTNIETTPGRGTFGFQGEATIIVSPAGGSATAGDNDYTRINDAVQGALPGQTIKLVGTFNWTEPNAAASWAKGSDGVAANGDDYSILVPVNLNSVTFTADNLGAAEIQGPGDLAAVNLEGVLVFDGGDNQNWTISNIRFLDFDLSIGMFNGAGGSDAFNNTHITNNYIRMARDLNIVVAPADSNQNIGIHYSFGTNQVISGNTIEIQGDAISNGGNFASDVGMQSNTSGGAVYNGLQITNNIVRVLNAQDAANPQVILGIWENAHAHLSNVTVSGNQFLNQAAGNNPATNLQRAFRVTSHSSATTTVTYENNTVAGANIGFQWISGSNFVGNQPVNLKSNTITGNGTGVLVQSQGVANLSFNRIVGNTVTGLSNVDGIVTAENNWWGCNIGPAGAGCDTVTGTADTDPWLVLGVSAVPSLIAAGGSSTVTADMRQNSVPADTSGAGTIPATPVAWSATNGTMAPPTGTITAGQATSTFTSNSNSSGTGCATVDNQLTCANISLTTVTITPAGGSATAGDNDYTRINNAVQSAVNGQIIKLVGTFNWTETNAAASWALGSNANAGDGDDYSILVPANLNNVTFTADNLGDAEIQGPGDLAIANLEGVLVFDGGDNQNWTISNIRFLDFDLSIGMFNGAGGSDAFNNTHITNNYIRLARDLNTVVAPVDSNQNIGIHYSFGTNQVISGNTIEIQGDAISNGSNFASDVGMQSNTSGGAVYNGLQITNNIVRVLNAQDAANPQTILGIWENAHAHLSNITVSGNQFLNQAAGNNPATNLQRGFRVTSHSSATTTVTYENNTVMGANLGFQWITGSNFVGNQPVNLKSNTITGNGTGVLVQSQGVANLSFNRIVGNTTTGLNNVDGIVTAENNWWGCNAGPGDASCDSVTGTADSDPWLVLGVSASPSSIGPGGSSTVTADMRQNSVAADTSGSGTLPLTPVSFSATEGTMAPPTGTITAGQATSTFTSTSSSSGSACAMVDNQNICTPITITPVSFSIDDVTHNEGNAGTTAYTFTITKTGSTGLTTSVDYATVNGTATAPSDFTAISTTTVQFLPADSSKQVTVFVNGDTDLEPNEAFTVHLSNPSGAGISDADGTGAILNDDTESNDAPVAVNDTLANMAEDDGPRSIPFADLTGNDSKGGADEGGQTLTIINVTNAVGGTVVLVPGFVVFTPTDDYNGPASFDYTVEDNGTTAGAPDPKTSTAAVQFNITEVNDAPTAVNDTLGNVAEDSGERTVTFAELTGNDSKGPANESGQTLIVKTVSNPVGVTVSIVAGTVRVTPLPDHNGAASFQYTAEDNGTTNGFLEQRASGPALVQFTISEVNDAPTAVNDTLSNIAEDSGPRTIPFVDLTGNDSKGPANESGQSLIVKTVSNPVGGTVSIVGGDVLFTPTADFNGAASFAYTVEDNGTTNGAADPLTSGTATASFTITPQGDAPSVTNATTNANTQTTSGLVITANPADGPEVTHFKITGITGGALFKNDGVTPINNGDFITVAEGNAGLKFTPGTTNGSFTVQASTSAADAGLGGGTATATITVNPLGGVIRFSAGTYNVDEAAGFSPITVERTGDTSQAVTVDYASSDLSNPADFIPCSSPGAGFASSRCDFTTAIGTLHFAAGETTKTFNVLISQDNYLEGPETLDLTLSNPTGGAVLGVPAAANLSITDDTVEGATNPVDQASDFVRALYHDMLNREPDGPGLAFWTDNIEKCSDPDRRPAGQTVEQCTDKQRESTAVAFFAAPEFQITGGFVYRLYKGSLTGAPNYDGGSPGRFPTFVEFIKDVSQVSEGIVVNNQISGAVVEANRNQLAAEFVQRPEFIAKYGGLNNTLYVDELFNTTTITATPAEKQALVDGLTNGTETRASVLRKVVDGTVVISEGNVQFTTTYGQAFYNQEFRRVYVYMEYVGFLRRNPDAEGFVFWLGKLNDFNGDPFQAEMVRSFILSPEYRSRFGPN